MEISYELIIEYILNKNINKNIDIKYIPTINNNTTNIFSSKFNILLSDNFYRYGIKIYDDNKNNISFWSSLLTLLDDHFNMSIENDEITKISIYKNNLIDKYLKSKLFFKKNNKSDMRELFKLNADIYILQYIADINNYTFIIFDIKDDNIFIIYNSVTLNQNNSILLFTKYENNWEPILQNSQPVKRIFNYNDEIITKIINNYDIQYYSNDICNKIIKLQSDNKIEKIDLKINKTKLTKMKINEVVELCKEYNFVIPDKYNKNILIDIILENI